MRFSLITNIIWVASVIGNLGLLVVLFTKARWKMFPIFTTLTAFEIARSSLLFVATFRNKPELYYWTYWITEALDISLEIAVLLELTRIVFLDPRHKKAIPFSRTLAKSLVFLAILVAAGFSALLPGIGSSKQIVDMHASVFTSLLTCEFFLLFSISANRFGFPRSQHVQAICNGLALISAVSLALDTAHQVLGWNHSPVMYDQVQSAVATCILYYWTRALWYSDGLTPRFRSVLARAHFMAPENFTSPLTSERS